MTIFTRVLANEECILIVFRIPVVIGHRAGVSFGCTCALETPVINFIENVDTGSAGILLDRKFQSCTAVAGGNDSRFRERETGSGSLVCFQRAGTVKLLTVHSLVFQDEELIRGILI